ncbi:Thiol-disulfide oxidoreductase ResA [Neolewinella maritima]|uniref:Thiol-disulfide oxidoreductase ResA n=1 Tax=Neolewinella maritima TaxID=1383882 RepID=A0ABN8F817_9BACT|nr:TlpA disulfide reductase family protein [Neolewinella maritima]CAH1002152.1 Thiol-disulfide oxidoreductase ResA [Neolewinella maritima]
MFRLFFLLVCLYSGLLAAQPQEGGSYRIAVEIDDYDADILTLGYYLLDNQYIIDTAYRDDAGQYVFASDTASLPRGIYICVLSPNNEYFQLLIGDDEDQEMSFKTRAGELNKMETSGSAENALFYDYLGFLDEKQQQSTPLREQLSDTTLAPAAAAEVRAQMEALDREVKAYQQNLIDTHPESFAAAIIKANRPALPPDFADAADEEARRELQWRWLQTHYFDGLDLNDERLLRTPFFFERVNYYVNTLQIRHPDTLAQAIDRVLGQFDPQGEAFKFFTVHFTNEAASSNIVGMDALYVHLVDTYYRTGKAYWSDEEQLAKMTETTDRLRPLLIGKTAPDLQMMTREGEPTSLYDVDADYTVLYFWRYDCPACKKSTPLMKEFYDKWKDRDVKIFSVCTKGEDELGKCWDYVDEQETGDWVQVVDPYQRYYQAYDIKSTPSIFLLDRDKNILSKRIGAEQLDEVLTNLEKAKATAAAGK